MAAEKSFRTWIREQQLPCPVPLFHQGLANHAQQEDRDDVGKDDCKDAGGTGGTDVVVGEFADQVGQVLVAVPAADDLDLGVERQVEDRLDHHHNCNRAPQVRQWSGSGTATRRRHRPGSPLLSAADPRIAATS